MYSKVQYHENGTPMEARMYLCTRMDPWHIFSEEYWNKRTFHMPWRMLHALDTTETIAKEGGDMPSIGR